MYRFYCTFHGTSDGQGMAGTIVVGDVRYETSESTTGRDLPVVRQASGVTRRVPQDYRTIQAAVNAASPGDLVLVGPGVYREEVKVTIPSLVIRGTDRNQVVVDGEFRRPNAISVTADGVAVENLTSTRSPCRRRPPISAPPSARSPMCSASRSWLHPLGR